MPKSIITFTLLLLFFSLFIPPVFAHQLKTNSSIGVVMHVNPDDDPIIGEESYFFFEFKDKDNKFNPQNCDCVFKIILNNQTLNTQSLFTNNSTPNLDNASVTYTFPEKGLYTIVLTGKPNQENSFKEFSIKFDLRVTREATSNNPEDFNLLEFVTSHIYHVLGAIIIVAFFSYAIIRNSKK